VEEGDHAGDDHQQTYDADRAGLIQEGCDKAEHGECEKPGAVPGIIPGKDP
jgi:hypothetical protein